MEASSVLLLGFSIRMDTFFNRSGGIKRDISGEPCSSNAKPSHKKKKIENMMIVIWISGLRVQL